MNYALSVLAAACRCASIDDFLDEYSWEVKTSSIRNPSKVTCYIRSKSANVVGVKELTLTRFDIAAVCYGASAVLKKSDISAARVSKIPELIRRKYGVDIHDSDVVDGELDLSKDKLILNISPTSLQWYGSTTIILQD